MRNYLKLVPIFVSMILLSMDVNATSYTSTLWHNSFKNQVEKSDVIFIGTVAKQRTQWIKGLALESTVLVHFEDIEVVTKDGLVSLPGRRVLRFFGRLYEEDLIIPASPKEIQVNPLLELGNRVLVFVNGNGVKRVPLLYEEVGFGIWLINPDGTLTNSRGVSLVGVEDLNFKLVERINDCDFSELNIDADDIRVSMLNEYGELVELSAEESLNILRSAPCPNGGHWRRDGLPVGTPQTRMSVTAFVEAIQKQLPSSAPISTLQKYLIVRGPFHSFTASDDTINQYDDFVRQNKDKRKFSATTMRNFNRREAARARSQNTKN